MRIMCTVKGGMPLPNYFLHLALFHISAYPGQVLGVDLSSQRPNCKVKKLAKLPNTINNDIFWKHKNIAKLVY